MPSNKWSSSATSSTVVVESLQTVAEFPAPLKVTTLTSLPTDMAEVLQHTKPSQNLNHLGAAEPEKMGGADKDEAEHVSCDRLDVEDHHHSEEDGEEEQDYDEVVVNQTPLNEVTSMTDRTSPWTSVLSDPDLSSLESGEQAEDLNMGGSGGSRRREVVGEEDSSSLVGSGGDASDVDSDSEDVTLQDVPQELSEEEEEEEAGLSGTAQQAAGSQEGPQPAYPFGLLPNTSAVCY